MNDELDVRGVQSELPLEDEPDDDESEGAVDRAADSTDDLEASEAEGEAGATIFLPERILDEKVKGMARCGLRWVGEGGRERERECGW